VVEYAIDCYCKKKNLFSQRGANAQACSYWKIKKGKKNIPKFWSPADIYQ
jgi:hypothetical protein